MGQKIKKMFTRENHQYKRLSVEKMDTLYTQTSKTLLEKKRITNNKPKEK